MMNAVNAPLGIAPHPFHVVGVCPTRNVFLGAVLDGFMGVAKAGQASVAEQFIGVDSGIRAGMSLNHRYQGTGLHIWHNLDDSRPSAFHHTGNDGLACCPTSTLPRSLPADVRFVHLNLSEQDHIVLSHEGAYLFEHSPSCLVSDANLSLKLLGGYASSGRGHEEYGMEPRLERRGRLVKDGIGCRGDVSSAELTAIDLPPRDSEVLGNTLALGAGYPFRPTGALQELKARVFIWELGIELLYRVLVHDPILPDKVRAVKG